MLKTQEFFNEAYRLNSSVIDHMPDEFKTPEICFSYAVETTTFWDCPIPEERLTIKVALAAKLNALEKDSIGNGEDEWIPEQIKVVVNALVIKGVDPSTLDDDYDGSDIDPDDYL